MVTGKQIREARNRLGLSQEQLAQRVQVTQRTVGNWERGSTIPRDKMPALRSVLGIDANEQPALRTASDVELLAEIARRFTRSREEVMGNAEHPAPIVDDDPDLAVVDES